MPFTVEQFSRCRPFLYHLTADANLARIRRTKLLESAAALFHASGHTQHLTCKRRQSIVIPVGNDQVTIRDQAPLHQGNITFEDGWGFGDVIRCLNERVFFWPGKHDGPISYGCRHYERYVDERPVILRFRFADLLTVNPGIIPMFCRYNSGSPRCSKGRGSARGASTFVPCHEAGFTPSATVEVTFVESVRLPKGVEVGPSVSGPWRRTF